MSFARWNITKTSSGAYRLTTILAYSSAVSVPLNNNTNGANLVQLNYTNNSNYYDEWIFEPVEMDAYLLGIIDNSEGHDHTTFVSEITPNLQASGFEQVDSMLTESVERRTVLSQMKEHGVIVIRSHGGFNSLGSYMILDDVGLSSIRVIDIYDYENDVAIYDSVNVLWCCLLVVKLH